MDNLLGDGGNNVFTGDNTGTTATVTAGDQINGGAGTDTFNYFVAAAGGAVVVPQLTAVENVNLIGVTTAAVTADFTNAVGLQQVALKNTTTTGSTITVGAGVAAGLDNVKAAAGTETFTGPATQTAATLNVVNGSNVGTVNVDGAALTTLNVVSAAGAANTIGSLASTGTETTLNVSGAGDLTINTVGASLTTINASAATGKTVINAAGTGNITYTGGTGNDTVKFAAGELTKADVLDGGAGTDTLAINDTAPVYAVINAAKNFEVLGLNTTGATVDASQITNGINQFAVGPAVFTPGAPGTSTALTETFTNTLSTSKFTIDNTGGNSGTISISNKVGETGTSITIDNQDTASHSLAALTLTGATNVALASTGKAGNVITALSNSDNSSITVTGSADLTLALKATAVGSKVDGSAVTGVLNLTGNTTAFATGSSLGDTLIGGSKADVLTASVNGGTLTGNGGNDTFNVTVAKAGATTGYAVTTITDFTKGDILKLDAVSTAVTKVDLSTATSVDLALAALTAGTTAHASWGTYAGNTYVVSADNVAGVGAADTIVKLAGVLDLSTSTVATGAVTFA